MERTTKVCSLLMGLLLLCNFSYSQVYPVQATVQLSPPYSLYLADYVESGSERLALNVFLSDIARPDLNVRFRLKIIGQGVTLETKPEYLPPPVSIQGGVPLRLTSADLADYFHPNNLIFQGMSARQYAQRGKLPEGVYQFCFEVLEYNRGLKISNTSCAVAWLVLNDPPIVNLPRQNEKLKAQSVQNVVLQWTPRHTGSPNSAFTTEYEIRMVEVWPDSRNPNDAILTSPPILEETTRNNIFIYGPAETPLEPGRRYAFRIQAKSIAGVDELDLFKNQGYSEVVSFVYGDACDLPTGISAHSVSSSRFTLGWEPLFNHTAFKVRYREKGTQDWYENDVTLSSTDIYGLKGSTTYEYQVASTCGFFDGEYSPVATVTTTDEVPIGYSCGVPITPFNLDPAELTGSLKPGDVIQAGDFEVTLVTVNGSNGIFSGEGVVEVPYLNAAKVKTSFNNITVNKQLRMVNGFMDVTGAAVDVVPQGVMDVVEELSETLDVIDSALTTVEENIPGQVDWTSFVPDTLIAISGEIASVAKNDDGSVSITDTQGNTRTLPAGTNTAVTDAAGNGYLVDKKGNVHKTSSDVAEKLANREYNLIVRFGKDRESKYGFDRSKFNPPSDKETLADGYEVAWKSVASGAIDPVVAIIGGSGIDESRIRFESGGIPVSTTPIASDRTTRLSITGGSDGSFEDLLALYTPADSSKEEVLGKLKVASYDEIKRQVVIVPVNGSLPAGLTKENITDSLNAIYRQAVVDWEVEIRPAISVALASPFDDGGSGLLSNYTDDMKKVIRAYGTLEDDKYYLFLVSNPASGLLGYMPRGKQAGFIFPDQHPSSRDVVRTMAHELGHGAFHLHHTFEEPNFPLAKGTTDNLMDYPAGNKLYKFQWDKMRYPDIVIGLFEEDSSAQYTKGEYFAKVLQQIRCAYASGEDQIRMPEKYVAETEGFAVFDYGFSVDPSEINGLVIRTANWKRIGNSAFISGIRNAKLDPHRGEINFSNFAIKVPAPVYHNNDGISPFEHLTDYLFPTETNAVARDFEFVLNKIGGRLKDDDIPIRDEDIRLLKIIASCGARRFTPEQRYILIKKIARHSTFLTEYYEDLVLDLIESFDGDINTYATSLLGYFKDDQDLMTRLFYYMHNEDGESFWKGNENNLDRFLSVVYSIWSNSEFAKKSYEYTEVLLPGADSFSPEVISYKGDEWFPEVTYGDYAFGEDKIRIRAETSHGAYGTLEYGYFQPVTILFELDNKTQITEIGVPAIYFAGLTRGDNIERNLKKMGLAVDVVLTFSGVGNVAKLRHLTRLKQVGKVVLGAVEITSGVADIIVNYSDLCLGNEAFCEAFQKYNTYVQLGLVGSGIVSATFKSARKSAYDEFQKHRDDLVEKFGVNDSKVAMLDEHFADMTTAATSAGIRSTRPFINGFTDAHYLKAEEIMGDRVGALYQEVIDNPNITATTVADVEDLALKKKWRLKPNDSYTDNGYQYETDHYGRITSCKGQLKLDDVKRGQDGPKVGTGDGKLPNDVGGHLIGRQFGGAGDATNVVPMDKSVNEYSYNGKFGKYEIEWRKLLLDNPKNTIEVDIEVVYKPGNFTMRPDEFIIFERVNGKTRQFAVPNN